MVRRRRRRGQRGQALAEVAIVAPLFFLIFFAIIDLARVIWANDAVANAAREGARYASVHAGWLELTEPVSKDDIREHAAGFLVAAGISPSVSVCFSAVHVATQQQGCTGDTDEKPTIGYDRGNLVTVRVTSHVPVLAGSLIGIGQFTVTGESTVLINN